MERIKNNSQAGFSLIELIAAISILVMMLAAVWVFILRGYEFQELELQQIVNQEEARKAIETMAKEIREADQADNGAYAIDTATATTFIFYSDIDNDDNREKVEYRLEGTEIIKEVYEPSEFPVTYPSEGEETVVAQNIQNEAVNIFNYYDGSYTGSEDPLAFPVNITNIRLVQITVIIDNNPNREPDAFTLSTDVQIRNLKDNL